jgi:hypothetical protein
MLCNDKKIKFYFHTIKKIIKNNFKNGEVILCTLQNLE